jgi:PAS domain S-box-containing protein
MQKLLDLQTVQVVCCVANLALFLGLWLVKVSNRTYPGFRQWVAASAGIAVSTGLLVYQGLQPMRPIVVLINLSFFCYPLFLSRGFRLFAGLSPKNWIAHLVLLLVGSAAAYFTYVRPDSSIRVFALSLLLVFLFADCAWLVRGVQGFAPPAVKWSLIGGLSLLAAWNLLRVPLIARSPAAGGLSPPAAQILTMLVMTAVNIVIGVGLILLNFARASESLRESEERFGSAMRHSPIGMALLAPDGRWLEVNPSFCQIVGYTREELLGRTFQSITHPDDKVSDEQSIAPLLNREISSYQREKRYLHKNGKVVWVHVHASIVFKPDGTPWHLVSQIIDVTERKKSEQALAGYQAKLALAMDAARLGYWEFDPETRHFTFDESFFKLLGTTAQREGGLRLSADEYARRFFLPEDATRMEDELERANAATDHRYQRQYERRFRRADNSLGTMSVRLSLEKDVAGRTVRVYGLSQDITEQAEAAQQHRVLETQLRHAQKMDALGTLAGGIAHDFNNILTGIMGNLQLAEMDLPDDHPAQIRLHEAGRASRRARDHIARILAFSRRYQGERTATPLGPIVQEVVQLLRTSLPSTIEIRTSIDADCPPVLCDTTQIHQVIMNLGTNAAHAMRSRGGLLEVELKSVTPDRLFFEQHPQVNAGHRVRLTVRDTGSGMEKEVLERIFEPFYTTKSPDEGTGLGLAMVHGIIQDHQGAIVVTSAVGHGTAFALYFPAAARTAPSGTASDGEDFAGTATPFGHGRKIMLVDDDETILRLGQSILTKYGFAAEIFSSPIIALGSFQANPPNYAAVISDLTMPGMTGAELARRFREIRADLPFILTSGYLHADAREVAQESGVTQFIHKPFDVEEFIARLRSAMEPEPMPRTLA